MEIKILPKSPHAKVKHDGKEKVHHANTHSRQSPGLWCSTKAAYLQADGRGASALLFDRGIRLSSPSYSPPPSLSADFIWYKGGANRS